MDHPSHGVKATVIDLGLARMDAGDRDNGDPYWTPFDNEIFEGEGDYQFDVYRMMRDHNGNSWEDFRPLTNVMASQ
jgi:serine/threonine-protein kinase haspin